MINVLFFAQIRELIATGSLEVPAKYATVDDLRSDLCCRGEKWQLALSANNLLTAVNQTLVSVDYKLHDGDEVAFFPPVTGG